MFRANIYSIEQIPSSTRDSIHEGIGMVAAYMGQQVASKELLVRLPLNNNGYVNPDRVGFSKLDKFVELHVMAVPLESGDSERLGVAGIGTGWSFVDTSHNQPQLIRSTTSHEAAHALGFVTVGSEQADADSRGHCSDVDCLMHKNSTFLVVEPEPQTAPTRLQSVLQIAGINKREVARSGYTINRQFDFCGHCKVDLRNNGEKQINNLRHQRVLNNRKIRQV